MLFPSRSLMFRYLEVNLARGLLHVVTLGGGNGGRESTSDNALMSSVLHRHCSGISCTCNIDVMHTSQKVHTSQLSCLQETCQVSVGRGYHSVQILKQCWEDLYSSLECTSLSVLDW